MNSGDCFVECINCQHLLRMKYNTYLMCNAPDSNAMKNNICRNFKPKEK